MIGKVFFLTFKNISACDWCQHVFGVGSSLPCDFKGILGVFHADCFTVLCVVAALCDARVPFLCLGKFVNIVHVCFEFLFRCCFWWIADAKVVWVVKQLTVNCCQYRLVIVGVWLCSLLYTMSRLKTQIDSWSDVLVQLFKLSKTKVIQKKCILGS